MGVGKYVTAREPRRFTLYVSAQLLQLFGGGAGRSIHRFHSFASGGVIEISRCNSGRARDPKTTTAEGNGAGCRSCSLSLSLSLEIHAPANEADFALEAVVVPPRSVRARGKQAHRKLCVA